MYEIWQKIVWAAHWAIFFMNSLLIRSLWFRARFIMFPKETRVTLKVHFRLDNMYGFAYHPKVQEEFLRRTYSQGQQYGGVWETDVDFKTPRYVLTIPGKSEGNRSVSNVVVLVSNKKLFTKSFLGPCLYVSF
jgi:hypothetical protein